MVNLGITDDHELVRRGLRDLLRPSERLRLCATWDSAVATQAGIEAARIEVLLLDVHLPDRRGPELCRVLKERHPTLHILGLSTYDQLIIVQEMMDAGAGGYLLKSTDLGEIETAVQTVCAGQAYLAPTLAERMSRLAREPRTLRLTRREQAILTLIGEEFTTREIGERLCITEKTVETHRAHLYQKLGVKNVAGLVREGILRGYIG
ncbi:DNA-binding response regulator, NarL/FixJ family, contains REC and HTH domains [Catalinimonas alkaloidigena]|uniref:DNA-binding response regulator, NarL/FixJ family, contains REC and HTH domains n=1 Tax=Catalinimonas alkaloidigena TaxID=1075417 RepID=A0A1G9PDT2_9BACT|nr:response regulator transcription factor [Catalinimonas alkaloidigena]SDL97022.1 DNA-binding response regulator, NarL/FixJ family, contains REC and HTH domains [Catalinimonas alkaloidigena]